MTAFTAYLDKLACPACRGALAESQSTTLRCASCSATYPVYGERPVLIDESKSVFSHDDYKDVRPLGAQVDPSLRGRLRAFERSLPSFSVNMSAVPSLARMREMLLARTPRPTILVVGGGQAGKGVRTLAEDPAITLISTDPGPGSKANIFCDGHDLPFADGSIDAVITQAVLEHVADPERCVAEIHRVLAPDGLVYSEIPFMQQVHEKGYDFTRFSHAGQRRLFRHFTELDSGAVAGPGTALAWSWRYFLSALSTNKQAATALHWIGRVTATAIEQTDYFFRQKPGALDAASCIYFLGQRAEHAISDREIVASYRGARR